MRDGRRSFALRRPVRHHVPSIWWASRFRSGA